MLYMFNVDIGAMMTFDINLGMELVSVLKEHIAKVHKVPEDMQVLLVSGGIALMGEQRVCQFSAGTDTNPIFLYNKQFYHHPSQDAPPELLVVDTGAEQPELKAEVDASLVLPDTINTVVVRSHLAQRFCDAAQEEASVCERLVHEQHLQHQGYAAVIANMDDTIPSVKANLEQFASYFQEFLENKEHYYQLSETVSQVAATLSTIPLLPCLVDLAVQDPLASISSCQEITQRRDNVSLLDWLHLRNSNDSFHKLSQMCCRGIQQHNEDIVNSLRHMLDQALSRSQEENMRNIGGLSERFSGLERLMRELRTYVQEQRDIAQALQQNSARASHLGDASILPDLCASHRRQLLVMQNNHKKIRDIRRRIVLAKTELIQNIYMRMKWVYSIETDIANVYHNTQMYMSSLKILKDQLNVLQQAHNVPHLYLMAVAEVVRRRTFSQAFLMWANDLTCQLCAIHSEEVARRQNFQAQFDGHMLNTLFPGLEDFPPPFATQAPESFDTKLPKLTIEDIEMLKEKVSDFALSVSMPDLNAITQFFVSKSIANPIKAKEVERLVEEVTAMEQPTDSQTPGTGYLASVLPITDRGFESETDTEEFERVEQSPTELAFDKKAESNEKKFANQLTKTRKDMEKSIVIIRQDLCSLREWLTSEHSLVHSFLEQLSTAYRNDAGMKEQLIFSLKQELSDREAKINELRTLTEELQNRLKVTQEAETRERDARQEAEAEKERAVREATEQITADHRREMEAVRSRFRLMATATMERSPSELSLERMDQRASLESEETIRAEMVQERERALAEERQRWQTKLDHEMTQLKMRTDAEKQIWFNEAMRRVLVEKDRQLESLRMLSVHLETECQKHRETIHRLTGTSGSVGSESSLLDRVEALEAAKVKLEAELAEARGGSPAHTHQDMSTSIALCDGDGAVRDAATSPDPVRKTQLKEKLTKSTTSLIQQGKVSVCSCNIGETVLVVWEEAYNSYMILQESSTLYFLHSDSLATMLLCTSSDGSPRRIYSLAEVVEKEYCHARKPVNRYNVAKGTKFYRVKVKPLGTLPHTSQSSSA